MDYCKWVVALRWLESIIYNKYSYDPVNNSWGSPIEAPYYYYAMTTLNNTLLIAGGEDKSKKKANYNHIITLHSGQLNDYTRMIAA